MSGNRGPKRSSLGPMSGLLPMRFRWSSITIRAPWLKPVFTPPAAFVRMSLRTPESPSILVAKVTVRRSCPS
jgi:hypothetical protein